MALNLHLSTPTDFVYESSGCHSIDNIDKFIVVFLCISIFTISFQIHFKWIYVF